MGVPHGGSEVVPDRIREARARADAGDFEGAEVLFLRLLTEGREAQEDLRYGRALGGLMTLYGRAGRYVEAHVLARRLAGWAARADAPDLTAFAWSGVCGALAKLEVVEPLGDALCTLRIALDHPAGPFPGPELAFHSAAGTHAVACADLPRARQHVAAYRDRLEACGGLEGPYPWALLRAEAQLALLDGHPEIAGRLLERGRTQGLTPPQRRLGELPLEVAVHAALGKRTEALDAAGEALALMEAVPDRPFAAADCIQEARRLTRELEQLQAWDLVHRMHDLVAAAVLVRLAQVEACVATLPELGLDDALSHEVLAGYRRHFLGEQRELLRRVARLLEAPGAQPPPQLLAGHGAEGLIAVCAWCESVRSPQGTWLPLGHFVPREGSRRVTHGICPGCARRSTALSA